ncbi:MotA/TolQ/ExbB proton channel family protein [Siminovitchia fortis]|uniref:MotA/TolQ/ExbB proton channel family protein n=1 Tax=Siminovitchia fortis TaxID=254758 RepID=UPI001F40E553|nr:MotA/TolQ/ExbB proton channel family protein [Siminovitchia fortis]WHY82112.1 MotA/TolQ/ExbB proton channel family protein [Siminovitchia fortis]
MFRKDILTPIGIILGFAVIFFAIYLAGGYDSFLVFISFSSFIIVFGGLFASLFVGFGAKEVGSMLKVLHTTFRRKEVPIQDFINNLVQLARTSRIDGMIKGLERERERTSDPFIQKGLRLVIDGYEEDMIRKIMEMDIRAMEKRHARGQQLITKAGELSPAWGMIGTIVGLVLMLQQLDNPGELGPAIAVALITTFYGVITANLVFIPIANKLVLLTEEEVFLKEVVIDALISIRNNEGPTILKDKLQMFLTESSTQEPMIIDDYAGEGAHEQK